MLRLSLLTLCLLTFVGCFVNSVEPQSEFVFMVSLDEAAGRAGGTAADVHKNSEPEVSDEFSQLFYLRATPQTGQSAEAVKMFAETVPPLNFEVSITLLPSDTVRFQAVAFRSTEGWYTAYATDTSVGISTETTEIELTLARIKKFGSVYASIIQAPDKCTLVLQEALSGFRPYSVECNENNQCTLSNVPTNLDFIPIVCLESGECQSFDSQKFHLPSQGAAKYLELTWAQP